jgi:hypothetical protein
MLSFVVRALGGTSQDNVCRVVTVCLDDGGKTLLGDGKESVTGSCGLDCIDGNID